MGHTRWATHGVPNNVNAHPHLSNSGRLAIVHNGIIENYQSLETTLEQRGYTFYSDTDTEVLINLIEEIQQKEQVKLSKAVRMALNRVVGAYAIVVFDRTNPDQLVTARMGSPLAIGVGEGSSSLPQMPALLLNTPQTRSILKMERWRFSTAQR
jgi:glucosamine--fructose-6-phosphate aminotransferase (isomerizing)